MRKVYPAEPYRYDAMSSLGNAAGMLIRQWNFPHEYDETKDLLDSMDHDRCVQQDYEHAMGTCKKHTGTGDMGIGYWVQDASPKKVIAFFVEMMKCDPEVKWTGFRLLGWVNRSNGFPVFHMSLFANRSKVEVYSDASAPNVLSRSRYGDQ